MSIWRDLLAALAREPVQPQDDPQAPTLRYTVELCLDVDGQDWSQAYKGADGSYVNEPARYTGVQDAVRRMRKMSNRQRGRTYRVRDLGTGSTVALSLLPADWSYNGHTGNGEDQ